MTFQALAAMQNATGYDDGGSFDPSDEGELLRIAERDGITTEESVNEYEQSFLSEIGIDPEFFDSGKPRAN